MRHVLLLLSITLLGGCHSVLRTPVPASQPILPEVRSDLPILAADGSRVSWDELLTALDDAEAIILGETHDDAVAHATQHAIVADMLARHEKVAIAMEMFERDEQPHVDDYLDGITDVDTLVERTNSAGWGGEDGAWERFYQPVVDAAKSAGAPVVAANAPRRYVRLARTDGFERLDEMNMPRRALFEVPIEPMTGAYRNRFYDVMLNMGQGDMESEPRHDVEHEPNERIEAGFRSQQIWDATMAASIVDALENGAAKVVHLIGSFHCDFEGGTVQEIARRRPGTRIVVVSMQPYVSETLREQDDGRAAFVVFTH